MKSKIRKIINEFKPKIGKIYKNRLSNIILYGSQAREDSVDGSDIDLMVVLKDEEVNQSKELDETIDIIANLSLEFDEVISCMFMSEKRFINEKSPLLINIKKDGVVL